LERGAKINGAIMKNIIGLDIGGTKISGVVWDGKRVVESLTIVTPKNLFEFERNLLKLTDFLSANKTIHGLGVGMAGLIDSQRGKIIRSPNIKFANNLAAIKFFRLNGFKKVKIDNDANCFTRAELFLGQGKNYRNFLALTLGTGIGGGIVINGGIYRGQDNLGGELGHLLLGGGYLEKKFKKARDQRDNRKLGLLFGHAFAGLINIFAPQALIIGGGVATDKTRHFLPLAEKEMKKYLFYKEAKTKILVSKLKNAGAIGAALLVS
jgi:glucokinase